MTKEEEEGRRRGEEGRSRRRMLEETGEWMEGGGCRGGGEII